MRIIYTVASIVILCCTTAAQTYIIDQNFESISASGDPIAGWTFTSTKTWLFTGYGHNSDKYAGWNEVTNGIHSIISPLVTNPGTLTFWICGFNDATNVIVQVQISSNGTDWTNYGSAFPSKGAGGDYGLSFFQKTVVIQQSGSYYIRWITSSWVSGGFYLDDIQLDNTLPVELTSFTATVNGRGVELAWRTATEVNNYGFEIEGSAVSSRTKDKNWKKIAFVEGRGTTNAPQSYSYSDKPGSGKFQYRLKQIDRDGKFEYSKTIEAEIAHEPKSFVLAQNYPNPFNPSTTISFSTEKTGHAKLTVFNLLGQHSALLFDGVTEGGREYSLNFDASRLGSGTYFYKLETALKTEVRKMQLIR